MKINTSFLDHNQTVIVGLSGGPDSVYLLDQLVQLRETFNLTLIAAHLDHQWRKDSHKDVEFCASLCKQLNVTFVSKAIAELNAQIKKTGSQEDVGRQYRRMFFNQIKQEYNADTIALGHHADDQVETFFIRLIRGTTISGMGSIKEKSGSIIRPLLTITKKEILDYLDTHKIDYLIDETNRSDGHLRNRIRNNLIPELQKCDERSEKNILRAIENIQETNEYLDKKIKQALDECTASNLLDIKLLKVNDLFIQKQIIRLWICQSAQSFTLSESFINEIIRFLDSDRGGTHQLNPKWNITKKSGKATILLAHHL